MFIGRSFIFLSVVFVAQATLGVECDTWIKHLANEHHVHILNSSNKTPRNSAFEYTAIKGSPIVVAVEKGAKDGWIIESSGKMVTARNKAFGYSEQFDAHGNCVNSHGYDYNYFDGPLPKSTTGTASFNYDWKICDQLEVMLLSKHSAELEKKDFSSLLKKLTSKEGQVLKNLVKKANSKPFDGKKIDAEDLVSKCVNQINYLNATVKNSDPAKTSVSPKVVH